VLFEVELDLGSSGSRSSSKRLCEQLKAAIVEGRLIAGARLPPTRSASAFFGVSRNTAAEIYARLASEGLIVTRPGSGVYVANRGTADAPSMETQSPGFPLNPVWLREDIRGAMQFWREADRSNGTGLSPTTRPTLDFRPAMIDARLFPSAELRRVMAGQLRQLERKPAAPKSPQGNQGNYQLRNAIAAHIAVTRAVACRAEDVLVTAGAQQAFDLLARILVTPGETVVAVEDPGYPPMRAAFVAAGALIAPVRVDREGLVVDDIPSDAKVICVCPSHQFPLGVALSAERRLQLVALARKRGAVIIEDDYDGEFRLDGEALQALWTRAARDVVFYVGTFSKCMLPSLRLGFIVTPPWALPTLITAKNCADWHCPTLVQRSVAAFISEGHLARHIRKVREIYRQRRRLLRDTWQGEIAEWLELLPSSYGMHVAAVARPGVDVEAATLSLLRRDVRVHSLARYYAAEPDRSGMILSYAVLGLPEIRAGIKQIHSSLAECIERRDPLRRR
jgi:GntR family transcriptional regulator/MocR family aminotransferase